jgi:hypothetical protein
MLATLRRRDFALLWSGGLISVTGDWVLSIGLPIYVIILSHFVLATSLILISVRISSLIFGSLAGVFVDRWKGSAPRVAGNMLSALALPLLLVTVDDRIWIVNVVRLSKLHRAILFPRKSPGAKSGQQRAAGRGPSLLSLAQLWPDWWPALGGLVAGLRTSRCGRHRRGLLPALRSPSRHDLGRYGTGRRAQ